MLTQPLFLAIFILLGGGGALLLAGRWLRPRWLAWAALAVGLGAVVVLLLPADPVDGVLAEWFSETGRAVTLAYRYDALAQAFALLAVVPAVLLLLWMGLGASAEEGPLAPWVLLLLGLFLHLIASADLLLTYAAWELLIAASYFLATYRRAALPTAGIAEWAMGAQHLAGFALLFALLQIGQAAGTWQMARLTADVVTPLSLALLMVTIWVRMALVPFQGWALALAESPGPVSTLLLGSWLLLPGPYLWLCFLSLSGAHAPRDVAMAAGCAVVFLGSALALRQESGRRVQAGDTVARLGLVWVALGLDSPLGTAAGLFLLLDLLVSKVALHLALSSAGPGRAARQALFLVGAWGAVGLPPTAGFVGRWLLVLGLAAAGRTWYVPLLLLAVPLALAYLWRGWTLLPAGALPNRRWERLAQYAVAGLVTLLNGCGVAAPWAGPALLDRAIGPLAGPLSGGVGEALRPLAGWLPAWALVLLLVAGLGGWWSGALRRHAGPVPEAAPGPLQEAVPVLPHETGWLAWIGRPAPLIRLLGRAAAFLAVALQGLVTFLERHTAYFLLVVLVAAVVMVVVLTG